MPKIANLFNKFKPDQMLFYNWEKAEENLLRVNGLGSLKHRKQVKMLFDEIKLSLSECVFNISCQVPLNHNNTILIINFLKNNCQINTNTPNKQTLDTSHLNLIMAILYCFDCSYLENRQNLADIKKITSYLNEDYFKEIYSELKKLDYSDWMTPGLKALFQFSFQLFINVLNSFLNESGILK